MALSEPTVAVRLPTSLFRRLQRAAELSDRSVDEVLASTVGATLVAPPGALAPDLADELASMHLLKDSLLWEATQPSLLTGEQQRLQQLNYLAGERALSPEEDADQGTLLNAYHHSVLRRAQALAILAQRGYILSPDQLSPAPPDNGPED